MHIADKNNGNKGVDKFMTGNPFYEYFANTLTGAQSNSWNPVSDRMTNSLKAVHQG